MPRSWSPNRFSGLQSRPPRTSEHCIVGDRNPRVFIEPWIWRRPTSIASSSSSMHARLPKPPTQRTPSTLMWALASVTWPSFAYAARSSVFAIFFFPSVSLLFWAVGSVSDYTFCVLCPSLWSAFWSPRIWRNGEVHFLSWHSFRAGKNRRRRYQVCHIFGNEKQIFETFHGNCLCYSFSVGPFPLAYRAWELLLSPVFTGHLKLFICQLFLFRRCIKTGRSLGNQSK